jgi:hypothetical protein
MEASFTSTAIEAKRFGGLEVDGKFEVDWLLDWQIRRLAHQDAILTS